MLLKTEPLCRGLQCRSVFINFVITIIISIQFSGYLLMCRLKAQVFYYKASTKIEMQNKRIQIHMNKTINRKKIWQGNGNIHEVLGAKT